MNRSQPFSIARPLGVLFVIAFCLTGCRDFTVTPESEINQRPGNRDFTVTTFEPFEMALGDTVHLEGTDLSFEFSLLISESRCPANVQCIHPGDAEILFNVSNGDSGTFQLVAHIPGLVRTPYEFNNVIQVNHVRFRLLSLTPYPVDGGDAVTDADYRATIRLSDIND